MSAGVETVTPEGKSVGISVGAGWESVMLGLWLRIVPVSEESLQHERCYSRPDDGGCSLDKEG